MRKIRDNIPTFKIYFLGIAVQVFHASTGEISFSALFSEVVYFYRREHFSTYLCDVIYRNVDEVFKASLNLLPVVLTSFSQRSSRFRAASGSFIDTRFIVSWFSIAFGRFDPEFSHRLGVTNSQHHLAHAKRHLGASVASSIKHYHRHHH